MNTNTDTLEIRRTYATTRKDLFNALTDAEVLSRWMNAGPDGHAEVESDSRIGGRFSVKMFDASGKLISHTVGEYLKIEPFEHVSCTWITKGFVEYSVLSFELIDVDDGVELVLRHELPKPLVEPHSHGWPNCLKLLEGLLTQA